jgi:4-hydroxy-3-polyprenylbenzoate decarboxylase
MLKRRLIVGITGASGIIYGVRLVEYLAQQPDIEVHLIMTTAARITLAYETGLSPGEVESRAAMVYDMRNVAAPIASGSFCTDGMVVAPCSMNTLAAIAHGQCSNLLTRAADVCLKERRPLVLVPRETPLHLGHLRALVTAAEIGAVILPPLPGFYFGPRTIDDLINHTIGKILDQLKVEHSLFRRWGES